MKGVVFEIRGSQAVVMLNGAEFTKVPARPEWQVGDVITIPRKRVNLRVLYTLAACLVLVLGLGFGGYNVYFTQTALFSMDINPSLEFGLNRFDRVISVDSLNVEADAILQSVELKNLTYTEAVERLVTDEAFGAYLANNSYMLFAVQANDQAKQEQLLINLQATADAAILPHHQNLSTEYYAVDGQTVESAHQHGMTAGKYMVLQELQQVAPGIDLSEYNHCSVSEIKDQIQRHESGEEHDAPHREGH